MKPIRYEGDVAVFTSRDIDDYGFPEIYGYNLYIVVESRDLNLVTDYKMEHEADLRPIHRYSRLARFKSTLFQLLGERGHVDETVMGIIKTYLRPDSKTKWEDVRKILKHYKQRKLYDRIPIILSRLGYGRSFDPLTSQQVISVINDFKALSDRFERNKTTFKRKYFPNIRYIVFKLLSLHGINLKYPAPFIRTERKRKDLDFLWLQLINTS